MNKRPQYYDEPELSHPKRPRTFDIASNGRARADHDASPPLGHEQYTIAWICALPLELEASCAMLDEKHRPLPVHEGDDNTYVLGRIDQHNVVMVCLPGQYGTNDAAMVATDLKHSFPSILATLMVGIGGGSPSQADVHLGDVVVGTRVMQYDMGKEVGEGRFEITTDPKIPIRRLLSAVTTLRAIHEPDALGARVMTLMRTRLANHARPSQPDRLFHASYEHPHGAPTCDSCDPGRLEPRRERVSDKPNIHYGVVASGNKVMKHGKARDDIAQRLSALCFEMEAAGIMDKLHCLPIRGICDYSDSHKNKSWQGYAAATAAAYARELLQVLPPFHSNLDRASTYLTLASQPDTATDNDDSGRRRRLLESLDFQQIDARQSTIGRAHAKTCRWLLRHLAYQDWLDPKTQSQNHGFLWMRGKAGAGKSTMMKFAYLETKKASKKSGMVVASFFFNARGDSLERSIAGMYRSLLMQLLKGFPDLQFVLDDTDIVPRNQQDCPDLNALRELLNSAVMALEQRSFTCFIDALDECDELEVRDMVQFFEELAENATDNGILFRIFFSSRPYPYIDVRHGISLTLEDEPEHGKDLAAYVTTHLRITNRALLEEMKSQILEKAAGIFMWIVLVVGILNKESSHGALALRTKLLGIPDKLSDLFKSIVTRDQERPEWLQLCVLWILCAKRPLSPAEFRHALWAGLLEQQSQVDAELPDVTEMKDCVKLVTSSSKGLAEITKSKKPTVQFIHESVRDFLVKERGLQDLWPELGFEWESRGHERLRVCCAAYLRHPKVLARMQAIIDSPEDEYNERNAAAEESPFLKYASQQILHHANTAGLVIPQDDFLSQFFTSDGIRIINLFEKFKVRHYSSHATPLYVLADKGLENLIRMQMKTESVASASQERYKHPYFAAMANGHRGAIAALMDLPPMTFDDDIGSFKGGKGVANYKGRTPLSWAAQEGRLSIVKFLLEGGSDPNEEDGSGRTPLSRAILNNHEPVARLLIGGGADVNAGNFDSWTPLLFALREGHEATARLLIENGADVNARNVVDGLTPLLLASQDGYEATARLLIENGADVNARNVVHGSTPLLFASQERHEAIARLLIDSGADINISSRSGWTPLFYASQNGHEAIARLLIDNGAEVNIISRNDGAPLLLASQNGHEAIARLLIDNGADVNLTTSDDWTPLLMASVNNQEAIARLLIENGADVNARTYSGWTVLMWFSRYGQEAMVRVLVERGADLKSKNLDGWTAVMLASKHGHEAVARLLRDVYS